MKKSVFIMVLFLAVFTLGTVWAGGSKESTKKEEPAKTEKQQSTAAAPKKEMVINLAISGNPDTLDPQKTSGTLTFQTVKSIYDTLVEPDKSGKIVPALAESWDVSPDNLTWTFHLRKNVKFHNGDILTSADVKATAERIIDPATASPKASEFSAITGIETPDANTVVFKLSKPYSPLLASLASGWAAILPKSLIDSGHDFASKPVGTGPFKLKEWVRDNKIVLEKNTDYWMPGLPKADKIVLSIIPEQAVQVQGLLTGSIDLLYLVNETDVPVIRDNPETTLEQSMSSLVMVLAMNCSKPYLDNVKLRQAVNYAIDKQTVLNIAYAGGKPVGTFMDIDDPYYVDFTDLYPYNPEKAKQIIASLNIPKDQVFEMALPQNYAPHVKAGEMYQEMLSKVGLNVKIKLVDWSTWISDVYRGGKYDFTAIGHTGKLDPDGRLGGYGTDKTYVKWINPECAALIDEAKSTAGFDARKKLYSKALEIMAKEVPFVFTGTSYRYIGRRNNVTGFFMTPKLDTFDFRWTVKQ